MVERALYGAQTNQNPRVWRFYSSHQRRNEYGEATSSHVTIGYPVSAQRPTAIEKRPTHEKTMWMKSESSESYELEVSFSQPTPFSSMSVSARLSRLVQTVTLVQFKGYTFYPGSIATDKSMKVFLNRTNQPHHLVNIIGWGYSTRKRWFINLLCQSNDLWQRESFLIKLHQHVRFLILLQNHTPMMRRNDPRVTGPSERNWYRIVRMNEFITTIGHHQGWSCLL